MSDLQETHEENLRDYAQSQIGRVKFNVEVTETGTNITLGSGSGEDQLSVHLALGANDQSFANGLIH